MFFFTENWIIKNKEHICRTNFSSINIKKVHHKYLSLIKKIRDKYLSFIQKKLDKYLNHEICFNFAKDDNPYNILHVSNSNSCIMSLQLPIELDLRDDIPLYFNLIILSN
jgi:hypothetical protein